MSSVDEQLSNGLRLVVTATSEDESMTHAMECASAVTGVDTVALLMAVGGRLEVELWHGGDERLKTQTRPALLAALDADDVGEMKIDGPETSWIRTTPLRSDELNLGLLALISSKSPIGTLENLPFVDVIADILARRLADTRRLRETRAHLRQVQRWFDTMDVQLRVLDRERQKFAAVVGQSDMPMFVVDKEYVIRWSNSTFKKRLEKLELENPIGRSVQDAWERLGVECAPPGSQQCPIARTFHDNAVYHWESWHHVDGDAQSLYLTFLPIKAPDGRADEILVMIQDLSHLEVLRRSEARYRLLFERSPNAMIMAAPDTGKILLVNPAAETLTGYSDRELLSFSLEALYDASEWLKAREEYKQVVADDRVVLSEHRLVTKRGASIIANVAAIRFDLDGRMVILVEVEDVTEQRRLENELRHSQKMEAVGRLAGGVAHEFNNIMTVILAQAELLKVAPSGDESLAEISDTTEKAAIRAAHLTRKLLAFSRKEAVRAEVLDLNAIIRDLEGLLRNLLGERVALDLALLESPCRILADRWELEQIMINLVANARDAIPREGTVRIKVSRRSDDRDSVWLFILDNGVGMDEETMRRVFEPFFTTKPPGEGTGLGMSTVYRIVERCGGTIRVESTEGAGTTFKIKLPLVEGTASRPPPEAPASWPAGGEERILVVDDERDILRATTRLLSLDGYRVTVAQSGDEALTLLEEASEPFHLLLTDVVMPGMTGSELAHQTMLRFPETRVLFMSGYNEEDVLDHGAARGSVLLIQKPFTRKALVKMVRRVLDN